MDVHPGDLSGTEQAVLLVLMAESRPVANPELEQLGPKLDPKGRARLNDRKLITTTPGRPMVHELTEDGWALCRQLFGADLPPRSSGQGRALYTLLGALGRYFTRDDVAPSEVFLPVEPLETRIQRAYTALTERPGGWVGLRRLREALPDVTRAELDEELLRLYRDPRVSLIPEENQKTLTGADRDAAVRIGDKDNHVIAIHP